MSNYAGRHSVQIANHRLETWVYADATARLAATGFTVDDVGRIAFQQSDGSYWRLSDDSPITWATVTGGASTADITTHAAIDAAQTVKGHTSWEMVQDMLVSYLLAGSGIVLTSDDAANTLTVIAQGYTGPLKDEVALLFTIRMAWRGLWDAGTTYAIGDIVIASDLKTYIANASNTNLAPPNAVWDLFASGASGGGGGTLANPMTAAGDIIFGAVSGRIDYALASFSTVADASAGSGTAALVIDGDDTTTWSSGNNGAGEWLRVDLQVARAIDAFQLVWAASPNQAQAYDIQSSPDNATWTTRHSITGNGGGDSGVISLSGGPFTFRYWRMLCVTGGVSGNWLALKTMKMLSVGIPAGDPTRLPIGPTTSMLAVVGGVPSWQPAPSAESIGAMVNPMTTGGDVIVGTAGEVINLATLISGGTPYAIDAGTAGHAPPIAYDLDDATYYEQTGSTPVGGYIAFDLGEAKSVTAWRFVQGPNDIGWLGQLKVQSSTDGATWTDRDSWTYGGGAAPAELIQTIPSGPITARYWRLLGVAGNTGRGMRAYSFEIRGTEALGTPRRLGIGADGTVLTIDPTTHVPVWSAPLVSPVFKIGTITLGTDAASFGFTSIPQTYRHLRLVLQGRATVAATSTDLSAQINSDVDGNYHYQSDITSGTTLTSLGVIGAVSAYLSSIPGATAPAGSAVGLTIDIPHYAGTIFHKTLLTHSVARLDTGSGDVQNTKVAAVWANTAAITNIMFILASGNFLTGTTVTLYGFN